MIRKKNEILNPIKSGVEQKKISESDAKTLEPNKKPGKLYGVPEMHKGTPEGKRLPPYQPIVSNCGSEFCPNRSTFKTSSEKFRLICGKYAGSTKNIRKRK